MFIAMPADHPHAHKRNLRLADLADDPWIAGTTDCECNRLITRACAIAGFEPRIAFQTDDYTAMQGFVAAGVGVSLIAELGLTSIRDDIVVRSLGRETPVREVFAVTLADAHRTPATHGDARDPRRRRLALRDAPPAAAARRLATRMAAVAAACAGLLVAPQKSSARMRVTNLVQPVVRSSPVQYRTRLASRRPRGVTGRAQKPVRPRSQLSRCPGTAFVRREPLLDLAPRTDRSREVEEARVLVVQRRPAGPEVLASAARLDDLAAGPPLAVVVRVVEGVLAAPQPRVDDPRPALGSERDVMRPRAPTLRCE